jgi:hypothetical protein
MKVKISMKAIAELSRARANWVASQVARRLNDAPRPVDAMGETIDAWEDEAYDLWNNNYPTLAELLK